MMLEPVSTYSNLIKLRQEIGDCTLCRLCDNRNHIVFGEGDCLSRLLLIGEAPGETEDKQGRPFIGRSGQLLEEALQAAGLSRDEVYITNIVKCRPPNNRDPQEDEIKMCSQFLIRQIDLIRPGCILALGRPSSSTLLGRAVKITQERGRVFTSALTDVTVVPTYHPSYILRGRTKEKVDCLVNDIRLARRIALNGTSDAGILTTNS